MKRKFDKTVKAELAQVIREIEGDCSAELIVAVRARSGSYRRADLLFASVLTFATLLFLLFSPLPFGPWWVVLDVLVSFALGVYLSSRMSSLRRLFTPKKMRNQAVRTHAAAMFYEAGVANTEAESGLVIYLSLLERRLEVIADRGVLRAVPPVEWNNALAELRRAGRDPNPDTFFAALRGMKGMLDSCLPTSKKDLNELSDLPYFDLK